ncbi:MAG: DEAD/DEAH box helicase [Succiniclasticum sp.]|uniref:DEAD/DEAH box helicase n=1 Tax=Succiniclasticum sp. TaxID=2775030 RepID=UPI002A91AD75|nr:DEAD/DEAH box helicase [Succiniclasticum sp.]MDY6289988.1 DEAD/DEAH box helicase [Succiniclasticum sp.]
MEFKPHAYQEYAIDYIKTHPVAAILLGCGLGKTSVALTAINDMLHDSFDVRKVLVVAPIRVCTNSWPDEIRKWDHLSGLRFSVAVGTRRERLAALKADAEVYIINRENLPWLLEQSGLPFDYDMCVLDELSSFKNWQSKRFRAFMKVRPRIKRVVGMTGTPSSNGLMDLFAEYRCLDMGERLGRFIGRFRESYFTPDRRNGNIIYSYKPLPGAEEEIYRKIGDITISMKSTDFLDMPSLVTSEYAVTLDDEERKVYDSMKKDLILQLPGGEVTAANAASLSGKLSQMANGAVYLDDGAYTAIHDRKLDALEDIIEAANGSPVLVAYWYRHDIERISERLRKLHIPAARLDKPEDIRKWNNGEYPVMLLHPASAGHGLNLQNGGSTIVWFSIPWSLELYTQTVDRLFRQGQKSETVSVIHITAKDTIDGRIVKALKDKDDTQGALIDAVKAVLEV